MGQIYGMVDTGLIEKYIAKYERYADMARDRAEDFRIDAGVDATAAECFGSNSGEADAYAHVARGLRAMLKGVVDED